MPLNVGGGDSLFFKTGIDTAGLKKGAAESRGIISKLTKSISAFDVFAGITAGLTIATKKLVKEVTTLAARYETLGVVLRVVGNNAGHSAEQMDEFQQALEKTGISMISARQALIRMSQAQIDLSKSEQLARIAQDAAVIGNINSSQAFERMVDGIQRGQVIILKTIGINVQFQQSYKELAKTLGKTSDDLTEFEKVQARTNVVIEAGTRIAGAYEGAMSTAGKQALSLQRHMENLKVLLGTVFLPAYAEIIEGVTDSIKGLNSELEDDKSTIEYWGQNFRLTIISVEAEILRLAMLIDMVGGTLTATTGILATMANVASAGLLFGDTAKNMAEKNVDFEDRFDQSLEMLQMLADRTVAIQDSMTDAAKKNAKERDAIREKEILDAQEAAKKAESLGLGADLSPFGLLDKKGLEAFAVEMALKHEKAVKDAKDEQDIVDDMLEESYKNRLANENTLTKEELQIHNKKFRNLLKSYRKFTDARLKLHMKGLNSELQSEEWFVEEKIILQEKIAEIEDELLLRSIKHIDETGDAIIKLGSIISGFDGKVGTVVNSIGMMSKEVAEIATSLASGNVFGAVSGAVGLLDFFIGGSSGTKGKGSIFDYIESGIKRINNAIEGTDTSNLSELSSTIQAIRDELQDAQDVYAQWKRDNPQPNYRLSHAQNAVRQRLAESVIGISSTLKEQLQPYYQALTATTADSIADGISDGFASGLDSAEVFANSVDSIMRNALNGIFERTIQELFLTDWYARLARDIESPLKDAQGNDIDNKPALTSAEAYILKFGGVNEDTGEYEKGYEGIIYDAEKIRNKLFGDAGLPGLLTDDEADPTQQTGISGRIQGITETTAGLLEGQFNSMRIDMASMRVSMLNLDAIADNTERTADNTDTLHSINNLLLKQQNNQVSIMRSMGIQL